MGCWVWCLRLGGVVFGFDLLFSGIEPRVGVWVIGES